MSITVITKDNHEVQISKKIVEMNITLENLVKDIGDSGCIPVVEVSKDILEKIVEFCNNQSSDDDNASEWNDEFIDFKKRKRLI